MENHPNWKGGRMIQKEYVSVMIAILPKDQQQMARRMTDGNYILEHRVVMSMKIGRPLKRDETVHHINGVKNDNRPENLIIMERSPHSSLHRNLEMEVATLRQKNMNLKSLLAIFLITGMTTLSIPEKI